MNDMTRRTRPRGFAPWNPRPETLALVQDVQAVLALEADMRAALVARLGGGDELTHKR